MESKLSSVLFLSKRHFTELDEKPFMFPHILLSILTHLLKEIISTGPSVSISFIFPYLYLLIYEPPKVNKMCSPLQTNLPMDGWHESRLFVGKFISKFRNNFLFNFFADDNKSSIF